MNNRLSENLLKENNHEIKHCKEVAVTTVIKDEAAYIHEWIHHYLYFGFKSIYIGVNRTTDKTIEVLDLICAKHSNIKYFVMDWIDNVPNENGINSKMQQLSLSFLANQAFANESVSHCLSVDADEFFYPTGLNQNINDFINSFPPHDLLSVHWACQESDEVEFSPPFMNESYYTLPHVKTIISRNAFNNIDHFTVHIPLLKSYNDILHIDASGAVFKASAKRQISAVPFNTKQQKAFILHRMVRSECEYLALLLRQNPESSLRVKANRNGITKRKQLLTLGFANSDLTAYFDSLDHFINEVELTGLLNGIREEIRAKAQEIMSIDDEEIANNIDIYYKVLAGTSIFSILHKRVIAMAPSFVKKHIKADQVRDMAVKLESQNINIALDLMKVASIVRPDGPFILEKISLYEKKIQKESK